MCVQRERVFGCFALGDLSSNSSQMVGDCWKFGSVRGLGRWEGGKVGRWEVWGRLDRNHGYRIKAQGYEDTMTAGANPDAARPDPAGRFPKKLPSYHYHMAPWRAGRLGLCFAGECGFGIRPEQGTRLPPSARHTLHTITPPWAQSSYVL